MVEEGLRFKIYQQLSVESSSMVDVDPLVDGFPQQQQRTYNLPLPPHREVVYFALIYVSPNLHVLTRSSSSKFSRENSPAMLCWLIFCSSWLKMPTRRPNKLWLLFWWAYSKTDSSDRMKAGELRM
jgi:hypothetical protein